MPSPKPSVARRLSRASLAPFLGGILLVGSASGAVKSVTSLPDRVGQAKGAGGTAVTAVSETLRTVAAVKNALTNTAGISANLGFSKSKSSTAAQETAVVGSSVTGGNVVIRADEDIRVTGSKIGAANDIAIVAGRDAILESAQNTLATQSKSSSSGAGIGVTLGVGIVGGVNASASIGVSGSKSSGRTNEVTQVNTEVAAGGTLAIVTGRDAALKGATAQGKDVVASIGRNLSIESVQDTATRSSSSSGFSAGISFAPVPGQSGFGANGGLSAGKGSGTSAIVNEQSSLIARGGSLNATVTGATNLTGGVIAAVDASGKDSGKLTLFTGTLTATDIKDGAKSKDIGIGVSASINDPFKAGGKGANTPVIEGSYASADFRQDTKATIGQGQLVVAVPSANVTINRDIGQSQVVTKDKETGFTVYIDESAIRETVALLKGDTQNSTILQGVDVLANNPLKPLKDVINEVQSFSDHLPESGALERLVTGIDRLTSGNNAVNLQQIKALADDPRFGTLEGPEAIAALLIEDKAAFVERTVSKEAAERFRAEASGNPAIYNLFLTDAQAIIALRNSGGAITDASQLVDVRIGVLPSGRPAEPDEIVVYGQSTLGIEAAKTLVSAQHYLDSIDPTLRSILEVGLAIGKGPVGAVGSFALDKAVTEFAQQTGLDKKAAQLVVGIGKLGLSFLSSSTEPEEKARIDLVGPDEAATLTNAGITILGVASLGKAVKDFKSTPDVAAPSPTPIFGNPQVTGGNTHASTSQRIADDLAADPTVTSVHLNQTLSTVTNGAVNSKIRIDVCAKHCDGRISGVEVHSPSNGPIDPYEYNRNKQVQDVVGLHAPVTLKAIKPDSATPKSPPTKVPK